MLFLLEFMVFYIVVSFLWVRFADKFLPNSNGTWYDLVLSWPMTIIRELLKKNDNTN